MAWFVYLIQCKNNTLYTGITTNVSRRFNEHNEQGKKTAKFLRGKSPLTLINYFKVNNRSEAQKFEYQIKKLPKSKKIDFFKIQLNL